MRDRRPADGAVAHSVRPLRVLYVVTHPMTARILLRGQLAFLRDAGLEVGIASAPGADLDTVARQEAVTAFAVPGLRREIAPAHDVAALVRLIGVMRRFRPHVVNAGTPKAGLLGMLAARLLAVPIRLYTLRGLRLETAGGLARRLLERGETITAGSAHRVVCVSESLRRRCLELGLAEPAKTVVLGRGSSNGVDADRFHPSARRSPRTSALREELGIPAAAPVVGFVGRLTRDKGVADLAEAFCGVIAERLPAAWLLLVGEYEPTDRVPGCAVRRLETHPRVIRAGFVEDPESWYGVMSVLAMPSRREGFPNAPLEAAASGVPVVGYRSTGMTDAVEEDVTGTLVETGDVQGLAGAIMRYLSEPELARRHGQAGRDRVERWFRRERVWEEWLGEYHRLALEKWGEGERVEGRRATP